MDDCNKLPLSMVENHNAFKFLEIGFGFIHCGLIFFLIFKDYKSVRIMIKKALRIIVFIFFKDV
jgi:hypothetical protein